ncbi:hypothetical protein SETIT_5G379300v2 [Setaria italica]|uniref:Uncharacterized protein n=1 Tax=Setaria italica TaxID=4555 RepID=A0A368RD93_SETIT|nr:hypothetical protein SETIT_5G379300v2 [Setaria italica]
MLLPSWNNFLQPLSCFVVVRSNHDERLVRIILPLELILISLGLGRLGSVSLLHRWQKEEEERPCVCLYGFPYESLYKFEIEIWRCMRREYNEVEPYLIM